MAGRESSGNPSSEQGRRNVRGGRGGKKRPRFKKRTWGTRKSEETSQSRSLTAVRKHRDRVRDDTPKERRKWERIVRKKNEKRRSGYRAVHGKVVDWVDHWIEEGWLFVSIRFQYQTDLRLQFGAKIVTDKIDLCDVKSGSLRLVRQYFRRRGI
jgi:hypothetical protein